MPVHRQAVSEMGSDYESVLREIKQDEELAELSFSPVPAEPEEEAVEEVAQA